MFGRSNSRSNRILKLCQRNGDGKDVAKTVERIQETPTQSRKRKPLGLLNNIGSSTVNYLKLYDEGNWEVLDRLLTHYIPKRIKLSKNDNSTDQKASRSLANRQVMISQISNENVSTACKDTSSSPCLETTSQNDLTYQNITTTQCQNESTFSQDASPLQNQPTTNQDSSIFEDICTTKEDDSSYQDLLTTSQHTSLSENLSITCKYPSSPQNLATISKSASIFEDICTTEEDDSSCQDLLTTRQHTSLSENPSITCKYPSSPQNLATINKGASIFEDICTTKEYDSSCQDLLTTSQHTSLSENLSITCKYPSSPQNSASISKGASIFENMCTTKEDDSSYQDLLTTSQHTSLSENLSITCKYPSSPQNLATISKSASIFEDICTTEEDDSSCQDLLTTRQHTSLSENPSITCKYPSSPQNLATINKGASIFEDICTTKEYDSSCQDLLTTSQHTSLSENLSITCKYPSSPQNLATISKGASIFENMCTTKEDDSSCQDLLTTSQHTSLSENPSITCKYPSSPQNLATISKGASIFEDICTTEEDDSSCQDLLTKRQHTSLSENPSITCKYPSSPQNLATINKGASIFEDICTNKEYDSSCQDLLTTSQHTSLSKNLSITCKYPSSPQNLATISKGASIFENMCTTKEDDSPCQDLLTTSQHTSLSENPSITCKYPSSPQNLATISKGASIFENMCTTKEDDSSCQDLLTTSQHTSLSENPSITCKYPSSPQNLATISKGASIFEDICTTKEYDSSCQYLTTTSHDASPHNLQNIRQSLVASHNLCISNQESSLCQHWSTGINNSSPLQNPIDKSQSSTTCQKKASNDCLNGIVVIEVAPTPNIQGNSPFETMELTSSSTSIICNPDIVYTNPDDNLCTSPNSESVTMVRRSLFNDAENNHQQDTILDDEPMLLNNLSISGNPDNKKQNYNTTVFQLKKLRRYDRRNFCLFCNSLVLNFRRHIINNHKNETIIAEYIALFEQCPHESKSRRKTIISELVRKGNNSYNQNLMQFEPSEIDPTQLLPVRRPPIDKKVNVTDYVTCTLCQGLFLRKHFYQHGSECKNNNEVNYDDPAETPTENEVNLDDQIINRRKNVFLKHYAVQLHPGTLNVSEKMKSNIIPIIRKDKIGTKAVSDSLLLGVASDFYSSHQAYKDRTQVTRKLRDGAKLLETCQSLDNNIKELRDIFHPSKINTVIEACQSLCNLKENMSKDVIVGMNGRLSWVLEECSKKLIEEIVCSELLTDDQKKANKRNIKNFQECMRRRWKYCISTNIENARRRYKIMKDTIMPQDEDIHKFVTMLRNMEIKCQKQVREELNISNYEMLCKVTICHIITLNRRRPFEAAQSELKFYQNREKGCNFYSRELLKTFAEEEKVTLAELASYVVPAKGSENIATILLTKNMETSIDLIIECRQHFSLNDNIYLFARPGLTTPFDGSKVMRELKSIFSGLKTPNNLTATGLRKHVATMGHMKGVEFTSKLSQFMCHTQAVHDKNYVAPLQMVHRGIIGHYLVGLEGTNIEHSNSHQNNENNIDQQLEQQSKTNGLKEQDRDFKPSDEDVSSPDSKSLIKYKKRWTEIEKTTVIEHFSDLIRNKLNPGIIKSRIFLEKYGNIVLGRTPAQINTFIDNINKGKLKLPKQYQYLKNT